MSWRISIIALFYLFAFLLHANASSEQTKSAEIKQLDSFVKTLVQQDKFSGAILLAKGDKVQYNAAFGLASKRYQVANNRQTKFNLGSMNKMFTAVAVMQLVESGKLSLTDKLSRFADKTWLAKTISDKIEIQHLLTH